MRNIFFIGLVSFFTDIGTEMIYPIVPLYLTAVFGATTALVGVIEGIAESMASLLKVYSGYISDKFQRKKTIAFAGYAASMFYKFFLLFTSSWVGVLAGRSVDRLGKGIRTAPRDVLVSESVSKNTGAAFGFHKALDMAGASLGILIAFLLLKNAHDFNYKKIFLLSIIPSVLGLAMFFFIKEKAGERKPKKLELIKSFKELDERLKLYLGVVLIFTLGNSSNAFLLLKAKSLGIYDADVVFLYFLYHIVACLLALPMGKLSDKLGRKSLLVSAYFVFTATYFGFAFTSKSFILPLFILYGAHTAMLTGAERAYVAEIAPQSLKGTMLGLVSTVQGLALLPASIAAGILWNNFGSAAPFVCGAVLSLAAGVTLSMFMKSLKITSV